MYETKNFKKKMLCIAMNLLHLEGRPGLIPSNAPGMGCTGFPLTSALWGIPLTSYTKQKTPSKGCQNPYKAFHLQV